MLILRGGMVVVVVVLVVVVASTSTCEGFCAVRRVKVTLHAVCVAYEMIVVSFRFALVLYY